MEKILIPRREPELIQREADRRWRGDTEKVATTSISYITVHGIVLSSRYDQAHELEVMQDVVFGMSPWARSEIARISCDSQAGAAYSIELRKKLDPVETKTIAIEFHSLVTQIDGGHNGLDLRAPGDLDAFYQDPYWRDDILDDLVGLPPE